MKRLITYLFLLTLTTTFINCGGTSEERPDPGAVARTKADPEAAKELKAQLNGRWRSTEDDKSVVVISGKKLTSIYNERVVSEEALELFANCPEACSAGRNLSDQPCFSTRSQYNVSCYVILTLEEDKLEYSMIGGTGKTLSYVRVEE